MALIMGSIGLPVMSFLYGIDFMPFRDLCFIMLAAGGVTAAIEFVYQVITVLRRQKAVMKLYLITFGFSLFIPILLINFTGLPGAIIATIGCVFPSCIIVLTLAWVYYRYRTLSVVQGVLGGLRPAVVAMIASAGVSILVTALWNGAAASLNPADLDWIAALLFVAALFVLRRWKLNPIWVMVGTGVVGLGLYLIIGY